MTDTVKRKYEDGHYSVDAWCNNCGQANIAYLPKGTKVDGQWITCERCGCGLKLKPYREVYFE